MKNGRGNILPESMRAARRQFDRWRKTRRGRVATPKALWDAAVEAARECGVWRTAKTLRVNYRDLQKRYKASTTNSARGNGKPRLRGRSQGRFGVAKARSFVELAPVPNGDCRECIVEVTHPGGGHMRIRIGDVKAEDLVALIAPFYRAKG